MNSLKNTLLNFPDIFGGDLINAQPRKLSEYLRVGLSSSSHKGNARNFRGRILHEFLSERTENNSIFKEGV